MLSDDPTMMAIFGLKYPKENPHVWFDRKDARSTWQTG